MKIASVVGARPQFVKLGPICRATAAVGSGAVAHRVIHTGQHYDPAMSEAFFSDLGLPEPDLNLGVGSGPQGEQTARMLEGLEKAFLTDRPDLVLLYGDTNSTLAGALAAAKAHIAIAHVESGLRSRRKEMPEEVNRLVTDHLSTLLFCPTVASVQNLRDEGLLDHSASEHASADTPWIVEVGDVMKDAVEQNARRAGERSTIRRRLGLGTQAYAIATVHRAENTDDLGRLEGILSGLARLAESRLPVIAPLHPRTRRAMEEANIDLGGTALRAIDPLGYLDMLELVSHARIVLTDSGGLQKEAYLLEVPCVTLREETEWVELVEAGWNRLAGSAPEAILEEAARFLDAPPPPSRPLYGDGHAAERIVAWSLKWWNAPHA